MTASFRGVSLFGLLGLSLRRVALASAGAADMGRCCSPYPAPSAWRAVREAARETDGGAGNRTRAREPPCTDGAPHTLLHPTTHSRHPSLKRNTHRKPASKHPEGLHRKLTTATPVRTSVARKGSLGCVRCWTHLGQAQGGPSHVKNVNATNLAMKFNGAMMLLAVGALGLVNRQSEGPPGLPLSDQRP